MRVVVWPSCLATPTREPPLIRNRRGVGVPELVEPDRGFDAGSGAGLEHQPVLVVAAPPRPVLPGEEQLSGGPAGGETIEKRHRLVGQEDVAGSAGLALADVDRPRLGPVVAHGEGSPARRSAPRCEAPR